MTTKKKKIGSITKKTIAAVSRRQKMAEADEATMKALGGDDPLQKETIAHLLRQNEEEYMTNRMTRLNFGLFIFAAHLKSNPDALTVPQEEKEALISHVSEYAHLLMEAP